jgi:three-Cys-motif partner protein
VDGFCGGGTYIGNDGTTIQGTPLLLLQVVEDARVLLNSARIKPLSIDAQFHFIDVKKSALDALRVALTKEGFLGRLGTDIHLHHNEFASAYGEIKQQIASRTRGGVGRSVFVLDQKGYTDAPLSIIRDILASFSGAEVILTFAVGWLIDYLTDSADTISRLSPLNLNADQVREYIKHRKNGGRVVIQRLLREHLRRETGAAFLSPFFIRSEEASKDLWVVHLSNNATARNVMVQSHWDTKNHSWHPGQGGLEILGFDPSLDADAMPDFWFGKAEEEGMHNALAEDLQRRLRTNFDGRANYQHFVASVANETPAKLGDFDRVSATLVEHRAIRILTADGRIRRALRPARSDFIELEPQQQFHFLGGGATR